MNKLITVTIAAASILSFNAAAKVTPSDNSLSSKICAAAANEQDGKLRRLLKQENKNVRKAAENILCNGKSLEAFAQDIKNAKIAKQFSDNTDYIAKR